MMARSATLTEAGVSRAVRPRREPVFIGSSSRMPEGCSRAPSTVSGASSTELSSAQARLQALISSTREVLVTFMKNNFHAESEG